DCVVVHKGKKESELRNPEVIIPIETESDKDYTSKPKYQISTAIDYSNDISITEALGRFLFPLTIFFISIQSAGLGIGSNLKSPAAAIALGIPLIVIYYFLQINLKLIYEKNPLIVCIGATIVYLLIHKLLCINLYLKIKR
ncbi:MAG: hypothetical protein HY606_13935, partial [Planctomycetes bacterium]|nr:hypothetical protein [Planctomycetota bacterium]